MACKHEFVGHSKGVTCKLCGLKLTAEEYKALLSGEAPKPKKSTRKK